MKFLAFEVGMKSRGSSEYQHETGHRCVDPCEELPSGLESSTPRAAEVRIHPYALCRDSPCPGTVAITVTGKATGRDPYESVSPAETACMTKN